MITLIRKISIWISPIGWSFWLGAMIYELTVVVPLWSSAMPTSIIEWNSRPGYVVDPARFFAPVAIVTVISSVLAGILSFKNARLKMPTLVSASIAVATLVYTIIYFFPKNEVIYKNDPGLLSGEAVTALGRAWIAGCLVRVAIMTVGYAAALIALRRSDPISER